MKAVLISINPKWVEKIASGEKTIEVRKSRPKLEMPFKAYIYCTNGKDLLREVPCYYRHKLKETNYKIINEDYNKNPIANGKVIGEFVCDRIDKIELDYEFFGKNIEYDLDNKEVSKTCLKRKELRYYGQVSTLYGWNISDLKIYDKPKELSEFWTVKCTNKRNGCIGCEVKPNCIKTITRPPQSWCYVEELQNG